MDLSLRRRPLRAARSAPALRVLEIGTLRLHEEPDAGRVRRLKETLRRDGVLRNPPIVAPMSETESAVLDGANRVTALQELGIPHVVVQVVAYERPEITLSTWRHYVREDGAAAALRARAAALPGIPVSPARDAAEGEARLARRQDVAVVADAHGAVVLGDGGGPLATAEILRRLVALYRGRSDIYRVDGGDVDALDAEYGPGTLVVFPPFEKADILLIAARGGRLPAGITRHMIPGRALRVNTPLGWLEERSDSAAKQARLNAALQQRWLGHGVRYYAESTFLFDE